MWLHGVFIKVLKNSQSDTSRYYTEPMQPFGLIIAVRITSQCRSAELYGLNGASTTALVSMHVRGKHSPTQALASIQKAVYMHQVRVRSGCSCTRASGYVCLHRRPATSLSPIKGHDNAFRNHYLILRLITVHIRELPIMTRKRKNLRLTKCMRPRLT